jgi:hypothetical protein
MSHFLERLVERARGTAARVEPLVTPWFAPTPIVEIASEVDASPRQWRDQQQGGKKVSSSRASIEKEAPAEQTGTGPKILREPDKSSLPSEPEKLLVPPKIVAADSIVRRPPARDRPALLVKNGAGKKESVTAPPAKRPGSPTPATTTPRNFEDRFAAPNESPEQPPIVRVTIGRIDVRATPPAAPSRKSSQRSEPKLTLDAYLKSRREGTR